MAASKLLDFSGLTSSSLGKLPESPQGCAVTQTKSDNVREGFQHLAGADEMFSFLSPRAALRVGMF